uniref:Uncharacterized protein n=1 Tax=Cacopsylla melanoneura TaxID=428564 RepID=A0A8D8LL14_9HEMI
MASKNIQVCFIISANLHFRQKFATLHRGFSCQKVKDMEKRSFGNTNPLLLYKLMPEKNVKLRNMDCIRPAIQVPDSYTNIPDSFLRIELFLFLFFSSFTCH